MSRDLDVLELMVSKLDDVELSELIEALRMLAVRAYTTDPVLMVMVAVGRVLKSERSRRLLILAEMELDLDGGVGELLDPHTGGGYDGE